jgi:serpin B
MKQIFKGGFANIADDPLWVSDIKQKTFVEVNEKGTEAAAVTSIVFRVGAQVKGLVKPPVRFFANRPFLFLIREKSTGIILFIGRIDEPRE